MPVKHALLASVAAIAFTVPVTVASAQFYDRQLQAQSSHNPIQIQMFDARTRAAPPAQRPKPDTAAPMAQYQPNPDPVRVQPVKIERPLTEEEIAAKAAVDALFEREPALAKAREMPDPALVREAVRRHAERDARIATEKARQQAEEAKRNDLEAKAKAREARLAAAKPQREALPKPTSALAPQPSNRAQPSAPTVRTAQHKPAVQHKSAAQHQPARRPAGASVTIKPF